MAGNRSSIATTMPGIKDNDCTGTNRPANLWRPRSFCPRGNNSPDQVPPAMLLGKHSGNLREVNATNKKQKKPPQKQWPKEQRTEESRHFEVNNGLTPFKNLTYAHF
jgi:hypothetical protein